MLVSILVDITPPKHFIRNRFVALFSSHAAVVRVRSTVEEYPLLALQSAAAAAAAAAAFAAAAAAAAAANAFSKKN